MTTSEIIDRMKQGEVLVLTKKDENNRIGKVEIELNKAGNTIRLFQNEEHHEIYLIDYLTGTQIIYESYKNTPFYVNGTIKWKTLLMYYNFTFR